MLGCATSSMALVPVDAESTIAYSQISAETTSDAAISATITRETSSFVVIMPAPSDAGGTQSVSPTSNDTRGHWDTIPLTPSYLPMATTRAAGMSNNKPPGPPPQKNASSSSGPQTGEGYPSAPSTSDTAPPNLVPSLRLLLLWIDWAIAVLTIVRDVIHCLLTRVSLPGSPSDCLCLSLR
ncbi:hypothetical protein BJV74DRAFT_168551 [Russula compacta]|nr:hypothetical protein BJV74DRAFT_168551 [Russula compacta]